MYGLKAVPFTNLHASWCSMKLAGYPMVHLKVQMKIQIYFLGFQQRVKSFRAWLVPMTLNDRICFE